MTLNTYQNQFKKNLKKLVKLRKNRGKNSKKQGKKCEKTGKKDKKLRQEPLKLITSLSKLSFN